ncbi:hypothetical protein GCM10009716_39250 [Streptomyces sodiiphilus]|uniref:DUF4244 domain-containing protein n=1 Tax=Streptomyces sodiiphilus TaxID=226217 RepID=A0ABN2PQ17_9ACTN
MRFRSASASPRPVSPRSVSARPARLRRSLSSLPAALPVLRRVRGARRFVLARRDAGMSTAEYAVGTLAAAALAAVLHQVVTSGAVSGALQQLVERALNAAQ